MLPWAMPPRCRRSTTCHSAVARWGSRSADGSASSSVVPRLRSTSTASSSAVAPAVTTDSVGMPNWAASSVTNASCSTCCRRPRRSGEPGSRYQTLRHTVVASAESWASRPYTFTTSGSPSIPTPVSSNRPGGCRSAGLSDRTLDAHLGEGAADVVDRRAAGGRPEDEVHRRRADRAHQHAREPAEQAW